MFVKKKKNNNNKKITNKKKKNYEYYHFLIIRYITKKLRILSFLNYPLFYKKKKNII